MTKKPKYKRILLKMSGEMLKGPLDFGIDFPTVDSIVSQIREIWEKGIQVAIVIGAGNIFRGSSEIAKPVTRAVADYIGMISTMVNSLILQDTLERINVPTRLQSAIEMREISEPYIRRRAIRHLEKGRIVIFGCGTGNPFFTTDTAASLRANEIGAEVILKGTKVDGVYDADPMKVPDAKLFKTISFTEVLGKNYGVMDATAVSLCRETNIPVIVFNITQEGNLSRVVSGEKVGTLVGGKQDA